MTLDTEFSNIFHNYFALQIYELATGKLVKKVASLHDAHELTIDKSRKLAFVSVPYREGIYKQHERATTSEIEVIDLETLEMIYIIDTWPHYSPHDLVVDERRGLLYCSFESQGGSIVAYSTTTFEEQFVITTQATGFPHWVAMLPDGSKMYTANKDANTVSVLDLNARKFIKHIPVPMGSEGIVATLDGRKVFVSSRGPSLAVVDTSIDEISALANFASAPQHFALSPDNKYIYITFNFSDDGVAEMDIETLKVTRRIDALQGKVHLNLYVTPDNKWLYINNVANYSISVVNLATFREVRQIQTDTWPHGFGFFNYYPDVCSGQVVDSPKKPQFVQGGGRPGFLEA